MRKRWLALPAVLLLMVIAAACGSSEKSDGGGDTGTPVATGGEASSAIPQLGDEASSAADTGETSATGESSAESTAAAGEKTVPQGGRLKGLMESDINTWDGTDYYAYAWMVDFITCNTLVNYPTTNDDRKNLELRADLAADMPTVSEDGLTYEFTLREGVKFSDGRPVTGEDVKGTFLRMFDPKAAFQVFGTPYYDAIEGVPEYKEGKATDIPGITVDGNNVTFKLSKQDGSFLNVLAMGFACIVPADAPHQKTNLPPPMTGPYKVTEHTQGKSLKIDRNPVWEENKAAGVPEDPDTNNVEGFDITIGVPPDAQVLQIKNGQADFSFDTTCCVGAVANELNADAQLKDRFFAVPSLRVSYATMNANIKPFDNPKVRQAANWAVDREALVKIVGGEIQASPTSGILADTMVPEGTDNNPYPPAPDVEKAKALIQEAGIKTPMDAGTIYYSEVSINPDIAQQLQSDLKKIGLNMQVKGLNSDNYYQSIQNPDTPDAIAVAGWEADFPDAVTYFAPLLSSSAAGGGSNYGDFKSPELDAEVQRINNMPPSNEKRVAWGELSFKTSAEQAPWINFFTRKNLNLVSTNYGGYHYGAVKTINLGLAYVKQ
jgi:ABC-type transport system substrate-binding protein